MFDNKNDVIERIISDDMCLEKILKAKNDNRLKEIFSEYGLNLTDKQIKFLKDEFKNSFKNAEKLDEKTLNKISAGLNKERLEYAALEGVGNGGYYGLWSGIIMGGIAGVADAGVSIKKGKIDNSWNFIKEVLKTSLKSSLIACVAGASCKTATSVISEVALNG